MSLRVDEVSELMILENGICLRRASYLSLEISLRKDIYLRIEYSQQEYKNHMYNIHLLTYLVNIRILYIMNRYLLSYD